MVVWQWEKEEEQCSDRDILNQDGELSTESDLDEEPPTFSTCTFKCIGATRSASYQEALKEAHQLMHNGVTVPVKVVPEPTNPYDSHAVAFQCYLQQKWCTIGYVVREVCDSLLDALASNRITSTNFAWVKYKVIRTTGPGYYAAIDITCRGKWSPVVTRSANTMY